MIDRRSLLLGVAAAPLLLAAAPVGAAPAGPAGVASAAPAAPIGRARGPSRLRARLLRDTVLDPTGVFEVTYSGLPNVASFQQDAILTRGRHQYAAWYAADRSATLARRRTNGRGTPGPWEKLVLPHRLSAVDSHNTISLGVSRADGRLHVAMDVHNTRVYYLRSAPGLVDGGPWAATAFSPVQRTLEGVELGGISYPQFVDTPDGWLQLSYRTGGSGGGVNELAEYGPAGWAVLGAWSAEDGRYTAPNGRTSDSRNMYLHGIGHDTRGRLHATFTWREDAAGGVVLCHPGGLSNHDTGYVYSDDRGRTWRTQDGAVAGVTGTASTGSGGRVGWTTPNHVVDPLDVNHALINQEAQAVDSAGRVHVLISYVPGRFTQCVTDFTAQRISSAYPFHLVQLAAGSADAPAPRWRKIELPERVGAFGRTRLVLAANDDAYAVLPDGRILAASAASTWTDWIRVYDGAAIDAFGECVVDASRSRSDGLLSVLSQEPSTGTTPSPVHVTDFRLG